jgi:ATP-dependent Clp protease protease subunit
MRASLPHAQILLHQPWSPGLQGQATDIEIHAQEILRQRSQLVELYAKHTGRPLEQVERDIERDFFMTPEQARDYGLIDAIIERKTPALAGHAASDGKKP